MFGFFKKRLSEEELYLQDLERRKQAQGVQTSAACFRMTVQDVFVISGRGTVVTGRVESGRVRVGDRVELRGAQGVQNIRIKGIEMFRKTADTAGEGDNVGLLLEGLQQRPAAGDVVSGTAPV